MTLLNNRIKELQVQTMLQEHGAVQCDGASKNVREVVGEAIEGYVFFICISRLS